MKKSVFLLSLFLLAPHQLSCDPINPTDTPDIPGSFLGKIIPVVLAALASRLTWLKGIEELPHLDMPTGVATEPISTEGVWLESGNWDELDQ